ncbi:MAG: aminotransferase class I/II-fold pyridoxal phosphate-dependent enzyme [Candidatus Moranbacteria bacterium]|nr:aminotransferase class I/II-fold pyridoxal phosphate-dependent enzyme [Candidatus Moranbacteria bacterium]
MKPETIALHGGNEHTNYGEHIFPIFQNSTYVFKDVDQGANRFAGKEKGYVYGRLGHPNADILIKRIALLEEAETGQIYPTGMAAISTILLAILKKGDHLITDSIIYGCTDSLFRSVFPRYGIKVSFIDTTDEQELKQALTKETKAIFLETPANPTMKEVDIEKVSEICRGYNSEIKIMVDNTFATPIYQKPIKLGADISMHSCTKFINGHGDVVAGAAVFNQEMAEQVQRMQVDLGTATSPFDCWLMLRGLKTLPVRMERHTKNAKQVVDFLRQHPKVEKVNYPGYSGLLSFELTSGFHGGKHLMNNVKLATLAVSLGYVDTLIQHPASMTHAVIPKEQREKIGITDGLVRLSVGLEAAEDIINDLKQSLDKT